MPSNWLNRIRNHEVTPPRATWLNITNELDKEDINNADNLKIKLLAHEETPPAGALNNIFEELDKDNLHPDPAYVERIKKHSEEAPAGTWENIAVLLGKEDTKVIPLVPKRKKISTVYLRVAAVAAIIAIILIAVLPVFKKSQVSSDPFVNISHQPKIEKAPGSNKENKTITTSDSSKKTTIASTNSERKATNSIQPGTNKGQDYVKGNDAAELAQNPGLNNIEKLQNSKGERPMDIGLMNTPNTYISITGADGQTVKVSSKFSNLIGMLIDKKSDSTRENIEVIIEDSPKWKKIFSEWREKMTNSAIAPSFSNFMDIIELSKILEEKNK